MHTTRARRGLKARFTTKNFNAKTTFFSGTPAQAAHVKDPRKKDPQLCVFCMDKAMDKSTITNMGINWEQYAGHPDSLRTCLMCKMAARSVLTEEQACKKHSEL